LSDGDHLKLHAKAICNESGWWQKEGAVIMENGLAEMHAQRPVRGVVIKSGERPGVEVETPREDLPSKLLTPEAAKFQGLCP